MNNMSAKVKALTLTIVANMTSNYGEGLGNISTVQKINKNNKQYAIRSKESIKNTTCVQSGFYDDLRTVVNGAVQKFADKNTNAANNRALEGGYLTTGDLTYKRNSSFYFTDAVSTDYFINDTRFHNNLYLATNFAEHNGYNVQADGGKVGLMPYQYEFDKTMKIYSLTIALDEVGVDKNFGTEADKEEKIARVEALLDAVANLSLQVKGSMDNAEPIFVVGGLSGRKTHLFENVVSVKDARLLTQPIKEKMGEKFSCGIIRNRQFDNEDEIIRELSPKSTTQFFKDIKVQVRDYYNQ